MPLIPEGKDRQISKFKARKLVYRATEFQTARATQITPVSKRQ